MVEAMDPLEHLLAASTPTLDSLGHEDGGVPVAASTVLTGDISSVPLAGAAADEATIDDVCDEIDHAIFAALVSS